MYSRGERHVEESASVSYPQTKAGAKSAPDKPFAVCGVRGALFDRGRKRRPALFRESRPTGSVLNV